MLEKGCGGDRYPREDAEKKVGGMVVYLYSFFLLCPLDPSLLFMLVSGSTKIQPFLRRSVVRWDEGWLHERSYNEKKARKQ